MARETNAAITFDDANYMVSNLGFKAKRSIPTGNEVMTRQAIEYYMWVSNFEFSNAPNTEVIPYHKIIDTYITLGNTDNVRDRPPSGNDTTGFSVYSNTTWTVSVNVSWVTIKVPTGSRTGDGEVSITFEENTSYQSRSGTLTITGGGITHNVTISQKEAEDTVSPTVTNLRVTDTTTTTISIAWSASDNVGITSQRANINQGGGTSNVISGSTRSFTFQGLSSNAEYLIGVTAYDAAGNEAVEVTTGKTRTAVTLTVNPGSIDDPYGYGLHQLVTVTSNTSWTVSVPNVADRSWIGAEGSGTGNGNFIVRVASYPTGPIRIGMVRIDYGDNQFITMGVSQNSNFM